MRTLGRVYVGLIALGVVGSASAAEAEGQGGLAIFLSSDIGNALFTLVVFGIVIFLLGKFAWGPILRGLQQRESVIHDALVKAKHEREEADKLLAEYRAQVDRAREEATAIVEEGKRDAEAVARRIQEEARQEAEKIAERAKREITLAKDDAVKELYDRTADIATSIAGQIIRKELSAQDHAELVRDAVEQIKQAENARLN